MTPSGLFLVEKVLVRVFLSLILNIAVNESFHSQKDVESSRFLRSYLENVFNESKHPSDPKLINYPTLAFSPETSLEIGVSSLYVYSAKHDINNRLSEIKSFAFFTLENQYGLWLDHAIYTDNNKWFFYGRSRYQSFPLYYYGIGSMSSPDVKSVINGDYILIKICLTFVKTCQLMKNHKR